MTTRKQQLDLIDKAFWTVERICESTRDWDVYVRQNEEEERGHRRFGQGFGSARRWPLTINKAARLFCVRQLASYVQDATAPDPANIFSYRLSVFQAYALFVQFRERLTAAFAEIGLDDVLALDYTELVKEVA